MNHKDAQIAEEQENNKETIEDTNLVFRVATSFASSYFYCIKKYSILLLVNVVNKITSISKEASANTQNVAASAEEQSAIMKEVLQSSQNLSKMAVKLKENISMFRI